MKKLFVFISLMVTINVFGQIPCVVVEWNIDSSIYTVVNYNYLVNTFPVVGLQENLEVLVKRTPHVIPDYDPRLKILTITYSISNNFDLIHTNNRMWVEGYLLSDRTIAEKTVSVRESENWNNYQVFPNSKQLKYIAVTLAILDKKASGLIISPKEQIILDRVNAKALSIWKNHINASKMIDTLNLGGSVNLDLNWESNDPENL